MLVLLRQGRISKWFSGIGQEAIAVGVTYALQPNEWIMPLHRNLGVFTGRDMPLHKLFMQWQGNKDGYSKGRERSFHFGSTPHFVCGMISHLGPQLAVANGAALAAQLKQEQRVAVAFSGDGGTSEGDFHEAMNVAAVWNLPTIFIIENNGYGLSTPVNEQYKCEYLVDKAKGYGMEGVRIDGNNILEVINTLEGVRAYCIQHQKPYFIECTTFRMRGHEEASGMKYVPKALVEEWAAKDPIANYENYLLQQQIVTTDELENIKQNYKQQIESELAIAYAAPAIVPNVEEELADVFAPYTPAIVPPTGEQKELRLIDALQQALWQSMEKHHNLLLMGQDIAEYGGAFKITEGFVEKFGKHRVRNTPLCESAILGAALGLSLEGFKTMVEMQFADFVSVGLNQIVNNLAKSHYRWGQRADVVVRMPTGAGVGAGPFHSQSNEAWFTHTAGLKVVYPSNAYDAKGLLIAAINDPNPVLFFEHKALYRSSSSLVPQAYYELPIGKAATVRQGSDACIITYGAGVHWALEYANQQSNVDIAVVDLRTLAPLDYDTIQQVVQQTGKVCVLQEDNEIGGIGSDVAAWIGEQCFSFLDAPVLRCSSLHTPIPFNIELEKQYLAKTRLAGVMQKLLNY